MRIQLNHNRRAAFTLIEIMVVVVILGILAATIIPQFIGTTHDAKVSTAKANIAELETAVERFNIHLDRRPTTEEGERGNGRSEAGARPVGICETELIGDPQERQNRASSGSSAEQDGHRTRSI